MTRKMPIAVLISGSGTNLQALIDACSDPSFPAKIVRVISNKADAYGLERAKKASLPITILSHRHYQDRLHFDHALDKQLKEDGAELVCLAGFMRLLTPWFTESWHNRLINIHPSLLPSFKGIHAQAQALQAGVRITGCTVHYVRSEMDSGPIIIQAAVPIFPQDDLTTLTARILVQEHRCYPYAVRLIAEGKLSIENDTIKACDASLCFSLGVTS